MNWYKKADISDYDKNRLEGAGQQILETVRLGDYDLTLVDSYLPEIGTVTQIGLAYKRMDFTDIQQQQEKRRMLGVPDLDLDGMRNKINDWINTYGELYMAMHNLERFNTYNSILNHLGFNTEIEIISSTKFLVIGR